MNDDAAQILEEWFGPLQRDGRATPEKSARWFRKDPAFDEMLRERFGHLVEAACGGQLDHWRQDPETALALVLLLDQFTRNIYRGTARMHAADQLAQQVSLQLVETGQDRGLPGQWRSFLYMPLMHAEDLALQERSVALFEALRDEAMDDKGAPVLDVVSYAISHRDIVARFGRFPHRNAILGRPSTPEEEAFLTQPGSSF